MDNKNISHGLWAATATGKPQLTSLAGEHKTEVAIIGGGYTGLSAALHLSLAGKSSILLEANDIGLARAARAEGATLYKQSPVISLEKEWGRLIIGSVGNVEDFAMAINKAWAKRSIKKVFPQIGEVELEHAWYGRIAMTTNHIPRFHVMGENLAMVTCYNGRGIGPGTVFGKLLAQYMMGGSPKDIPLPVSKITPVSMRFLRWLFYEAGSRMYHLLQRRF